MKKIGIFSLLVGVLFFSASASAETTRISHNHNSSDSSGNVVQKFVDGFVVDEEFDVAAEGDISPGNTVDLIVYEGDDTVQDVTVAVNGDRTGETGEDGSIEVEVPDSSTFRVKAHSGDHVGYMYRNIS
jgi:hypothetical protein